MIVYVLLSCEACESDSIVGAFASVESAQAARPGRWRAMEWPGDQTTTRWTTRREDCPPWSGQWHAIEALAVHP